MSPYKMSKIEDSIRTALSFFEYMNQKNGARIREILGVGCRYEDLWDGSGMCGDRDQTVAYLESQFAAHPYLRVAVTDANNLVHKSIVKYRCYGICDDAEKGIDCVGIFEVKNSLITSVSLYGKR